MLTKRHHVIVPRFARNMWIKLTPVKPAKQSPLYLRNIPCTWQIVCLLMRSSRSDCLILYIMHDRHFTWTWAYNNKIYDAYIVWSKSYSRDHALSASNKTHVASLMVGMHVSIQVAHDEVSCVWCTRSPIFHISPFLCRALNKLFLWLRHLVIEIGSFVLWWDLIY